MSFLHIIIAWLLIMAGYMLWNKFRDDRASGKKFWNFGDYNFLVRSLLLLLAAWAGFSLVSPEPHFTDKDEQIAYGEKTRQPWLVSAALWEKAVANPESLDYHFRLLSAYFEQESGDNPPPDIREFNHEGVRLFNFYTELSVKEHAPELNDIGYLFLAQWYIERVGHDADNAAFCLRQVENRKLKYLNYLSGKTVLLEAGPSAAESYFRKELALDGYKEGAWSELAWIYDATGREAELKALVYDEKSRESVPNTLRYKTYFLSGDLLSFYALRFSSMFSTLPAWGIVGDLLILFTWLFFLRRLSFLSPVKWIHFLLATAIGIVLAMGSWLLYEFYHHVLHFNTTGAIGNDFLYSFLGIGVIEELAKLVPFLLILRFTKIVKKPVDYLLIASAAGLGFAFFENLLYISQYGLDVIHARALTASVSHMASSALVAYGFMLVKFRYPKKYWIIPLFFLAAAFAHGFYDFWLLNDSVRALSILTLVFYLTEILVYVSFLNNGLNQTAIGATGRELVFNTQRIASFIAGSLILIFVIEYAGACLIYGSAQGNKILLHSFISGGYLIFFLSVRLSNIDIVPGEWGRIEFFTGLLPSDIMNSTRRQHLNSLVGAQVSIGPLRPYGNLEAFFPVTGTIEERLTIQEHNAWFELRLDTPITIGYYTHDKIYFRSKNDNEKITTEEPVAIGIFVREKEPLNPEKSRLVFLDWGVMRG